MVTIEDIVEELFGVVSEEGNVAAPLLRRVGDRRWLVDGRMLTEDLARSIGVILPEGDWTTVGGLVMGLSGELPRVGREITAGGCQLKVVAVRRRRIRKVEVSVSPQE
jgi:putative hemolysin